MTDVSMIQPPQISQVDSEANAGALQQSGSEETSSEVKEYAQGFSSHTLDAEEEFTYPDGGLRAWLVVLGCFIMACTCMYAVSLAINSRVSNVVYPF